MTSTQPAEQPMGAVSTENGHWVLRYERQLHHPPEKVWRALTESEHLAQWMPTDIIGERREGAKIELRFWPAQVQKYAIDEPSLPGMIRVWDPPSVFEWTWDTDVLRWELEPTTYGTLLTFTTWLGDDEHVAAGAAAGYHVCLDQLILLLDSASTPQRSTLQPGPLLDRDGDVSEWQTRYGASIAAATA